MCIRDSYLYGDGCAIPRYNPRLMSATQARSNDEWLADLRATGPAREAALDLSLIHISPAAYPR